MAVTGAHGYLGSAIVRSLIGAGHQVLAVTSPWGRLQRLEGLDVELRPADVTDAEALGPAFEGADAVIHAAARVGDWGAEAPYVAVNVHGTRNALEAAGRRRFVHISSVAVSRYGGARQADPAAAPLDGDINAYARTKAAAEKLVRESAADWVVVRPGLWPYGPDDPSFRRVLQALAARQLPLVNGGTAVLNTVHAADLADGVVLAAGSDAASRGSFLLADEGMPSWRELFDELARLAGVPAPRLSLPGSVAGLAAAALESAWLRLLPEREPPLTRYRARLMQQDVHYSGAAAREVLGFRPRSWQAGLAAAVEELA